MKFRGKLTEKSGKSLEVFTTRPETIYGVSFLAVSPDHPLSREFPGISVSDGQPKSKKGVRLPIEFDHPLTGEKIPVFSAEYVISGAGTGAVMGVPGNFLSGPFQLEAHDTRDMAFAKENGLPVKTVIESDTPEGEFSASFRGVFPTRQVRLTPAKGKWWPAEISAGFRPRRPEVRNFSEISRGRRGFAPAEKRRDFPLHIQVST